MRQTQKRVFFRFIMIVVLTFFALLLISCKKEKAQSQETKSLNKKIVTVATVSASLKDEVKEFHPFIHYLAEELNKIEQKSFETKKAAQRIHWEGQVRVYTSEKEIANDLKRGLVDFYIDSPFMVQKIIKKSGAIALLRRWKKGVPTYYTVFFTKRDSPAQSLKDLEGKIIGFDSNISSSGYFLPMYHLVQSGFKMKCGEKLKRTMTDNSTGCVFTGSDSNTLFWVLSGKIDAGATDNLNFKELEEQRPGLLKVIARTEDIPRHIVVHRRNIDSTLLNHMLDISLNMHKTESGRKALQKFKRTKKFDRLTKEAIAQLKRIDDIWSELAKVEDASK